MWQILNIRSLEKFRFLFIIFTERSENRDYHLINVYSVWNFINDFVILTFLNLYAILRRATGLIFSIGKWRHGLVRRLGSKQDCCQV